MWYRDRLAAGRPIGSGLIEGCCKTVVAARLKINSARWLPRRAERMGHLRCLQYSDLWDAYWNARAAERPQTSVTPPELALRNARG